MEAGRRVYRSRRPALRNRFLLAAWVEPDYWDFLESSTAQAIALPMRSLTTLSSRSAGSLRCSNDRSATASDSCGSAEKLRSGLSVVRRIGYRLGTPR
jgi:hypothetical protein